MRAIDILKSHEVHLIILDVMMPELDGIKTCLQIRGITDIPVIMLSAKQEEIDKITGFSTGADDYVSKPFSPLELIARVKAQLRRQNIAAKGQEDGILTVHDLTIDIARHTVTVKGKKVALTPREFAILELLASHRGQVFHADAIYDKVWREPAGYSDNTVMVHIRNIREKIEDNPREPLYIRTVWGVGYKIEN